MAFSAILVETGMDRGLELDECLRDTGISPTLLTTPGAEVTAAQEIALVRNIVKAFDDRPGLGIDVGARTPVTSAGIFALALMSSPTRRSAVEFTMRYFNLIISFAEAWHIDRGNEIWIYFDDSDVPADLRGFLLERDVAAMHSNWMHAFGAPAPILRAEIGANLRPRLQHVLDHFAIPSTDCTGPHLAVFDATDFDHPMPQASPLTAALFEQECADLLRRRNMDRGLAGTVRNVLLHRIGGRVTQDEVAATLHLSLRTMRRRLAEEGTSYRQVTSEIYGGLAEELLESGLTVEEVAHRLGYSGASSFSAAFRQWRGISPGRYARGLTETLRRTTPRPQSPRRTATPSR
ncbi:AraC family transcriptional regulator [Nocardia sp. IFM 10818]